uniref:SUZ domain-containing protein n=2 Tax=Macrostomum lignano TaxID=282301 RepID=A0A1I8G271_9PLAT
QQLGGRSSSTMSRNRQQQQRQEAPDPFEAIRATIRANQQARVNQQHQQQQGTGGGGDAPRTYRLERNAVKEKQDELSHNAKFQRIRDKMLQQPAASAAVTEGGAESEQDQDQQQSDLIREERVDSAARVKELKQIQQQFNRQTLSNGNSASHAEQQPHQQSELVSRAGMETRLFGVKATSSMVFLSEMDFLVTIGLKSPAPNQQRLSALLPLPSRWSQLSSSATRQFRMSFKPGC